MAFSPLGNYVQLAGTLPHPFSPKVLAELGTLMSEKSPANGAAHVNAAYVYFGQFVAHDLTKLRRGADDPKPSHPVSLAKLQLDATPLFDLDSVYGGGWDDQCCAVDHDTGLLQLGKTLPTAGYDRDAAGTGYPAEDDDLPRYSNLRARVPDGRNDENLFVAQLHVLFHKLHNVLVKIIDSQFILHPNARFQAARSEVVNIYQQIVLKDFLSNLVDPEIYDLVNRDGKSSFFSFDKTTKQIPIEFTTAAFRFGHSMVLPQYPQGRSSENLFIKDLFQLTGRATVPFGGKGGLPAENVVDWNLMLNHEGTKAALIDPAVFDEHVPVPAGQITNLAVRNLFRGNEVGLPSAQDLISTLESEHSKLKGKFLKLEPHELDLIEALSNPADKKLLKEHTPLWYYILQEASNPRHQSGKALGKLGSYILCVTIFGILRAMPTSILNTGWQPRQLRPGDGKEHFTLGGLISAI